MRQNPNFTTYSDAASPEQMSNPGEVQFFDPETGMTGPYKDLQRRIRLKKLNRHATTISFSQKHGQDRELPEGLSFSA